MNSCFLSTLVNVPSSLEAVILGESKTTIPEENYTHSTLRKWDILWGCSRGDFSHPFALGSDQRKGSDSREQEGRSPARNEHANRGGKGSHARSWNLANGKENEKKTKKQKTVFALHSSDSLYLTSLHPAFLSLLHFYLTANKLGSHSCGMPAGL